MRRRQKLFGERRLSSAVWSGDQVDDGLSLRSHAISIHMAGDASTHMSTRGWISEVASGWLRVASSGSRRAGAADRRSDVGGGWYTLPARYLCHSYRRYPQPATRDSLRHAPRAPSGLKLPAPLRPVGSPSRRASSTLSYFNVTEKLLLQHQQKPADPAFIGVSGRAKFLVMM